MVALYPNDFWATNELTLLLLGKGALAEAEVHARNAVRIAPQNAQAHHLMGMIMTEINRPQIGEYHYRRALELADQRGSVLLANLAWNLKNQSKMTEARALYEEAMERRPDHPADRARLGAPGGGGPQVRQAADDCSTRPRRWRPGNPERHAVARGAARPPARL